MIKQITDVKLELTFQALVHTMIYNQSNCSFLKYKNTVNNHSVGLTNDLQSRIYAAASK